MCRPFESVYRRPCAGRPVVKHQRQPADGPADPHVETTAIRQLKLLKDIHPAILACLAAPQVSARGRPPRATTHRDLR
jgi:hypothetical protein